MKPAILIIFPVSLCAGILYPMYMAWQPILEAWLMILCSLGLAAALFGWRVWALIRVEKLSAFRYVLLNFFCLALFWGALWSIGEEFVVAWNVWQFGPFDMPGIERYLYPGNSGMGFADGITAPWTTLRNFSRLGAIVAAFAMIPYWALFRKNKKPNPAPEPSTPRGRPKWARLNF